MVIDMETSNVHPEPKQSSDISLKVPTDIRPLSYTDTLENNFCVSLWEILKGKCKFDVVKNEFCSVDIEVSEFDNPRNIVYVELKSRRNKYEECRSFIIGHQKMINIRDQRLLPAILVWGFTDEFYFTDYKPQFADFKPTRICGKDAVYINKYLCKRSLDNLAIHILKILRLGCEK